jgi:hypothetical protein
VVDHFATMDVASAFSGRQDAALYVRQDARRYAASEFGLNRFFIHVHPCPSVVELRFMAI